MPGPHAQLDVTVQERPAVRVGDLTIVIAKLSFCP